MMTASPIGSLVWAGFAALLLAGCAPGANPFAAAPDAGTGTATTDAATVVPATSVKLVDRDVEAPEVFQDTDQALWDGRPSLGGVWVASPDAVDPERVILRNEANGKFVIGALFRRERDNPGPKLQISSDAADALGILAGEPVRINVTALRREEAAQVAPAATQPILDTAETVETTIIDPVAAAASTAIDAAEAKPNPQDTVAAQPVAPVITTTDTTTATPAASGDRLYQVGIFSVEDNANRAVKTLKKAGIAASVSREENQGKPFWSVTARGDAALLAKIKAAGFTDAYQL